MTTAIQLYTEEEAVALAKRSFGNDIRKVVTPAAKARMIMKIQDGFNPFTDMAVYEGEAIITVDGWSNAVKRAGRKVTGMPLKPVPKDQRDLYDLLDGEVGFTCEVYVEGQHFATGFGKASRSKPHRSKFDKRTGSWEGGNPVEREYPSRMAQARALKHGLRQVCQALGMRTTWQVPGEDDAEEEGLSVHLDETEEVIIEGESTLLEDTVEPAMESPPQPRTKAPTGIALSDAMWGRLLSAYKCNSKSQFMYLHFDGATQGVLNREPDSLTEEEALDFLAKAEEE